MKSLKSLLVCSEKVSLEDGLSVLILVVLVDAAIPLALFVLAFRVASPLQLGHFALFLELPPLQPSSLVLHSFYPRQFQTHSLYIFTLQSLLIPLIRESLLLFSLLFIYFIYFFFSKINIFNLYLKRGFKSVLSYIYMFLSQL